MHTFDAMPPDHSYRNPDDSRPLQVERLAQVMINVCHPDGRSASCELLEYVSLERCYDHPTFLRGPEENSGAFEALYIALTKSTAPVHVEVLEAQVEPASEIEMAAWHRHSERCRAIEAAIKAAQTGRREYTVKTSHLLERTRRYYIEADTFEAAAQKVMEAYMDRKLDDLTRIIHER